MCLLIVKQEEAARLALTLARTRLLQPIGKQLPSITIPRYFKSTRMSVPQSPSTQFVPHFWPIPTMAYSSS